MGIFGSSSLSTANIQTLKNIGLKIYGSASKLPFTAFLNHGNDTLKLHQTLKKMGLIAKKTSNQRNHCGTTYLIKRRSFVLYAKIIMFIVLILIGIKIYLSLQD